MFIRIKYIKNQPYAYKVRNMWTKKGTRQKTNGYLGRIHFLSPLELNNQPEFKDFIDVPIVDYLKKNTSRIIILDLIRYELLRHGFRYKGNNHNILIYTPKSESLEQSDALKQSGISKQDCNTSSDNSKHNDSKQGVVSNKLMHNKLKNKKLKPELQLRVDLAPSILSISSNKKPAVLAINNDFLCDYTLRKLVRFKSFSSEEECGKELAKVFIQAGIPPEPNTFIHVFEKVYSKLGSYVK